MNEQDDIVIESESEDLNIPNDEIDTEAFEEKATDKIEKIKREFKECNKEKHEYMDGWQRSKADYVNLLKRFETENKASEIKGKIRAVETLLPAFDALERSKEHLPTGKQTPEVKGFLAIAKQIESAFSSLGLKEVGKSGEMFDPALHDALGQDKVNDTEKDGVITSVFEKGWSVGGTVIRPAKVRVGHFG